jgi:hypothetical protein
MVAETIGAIPRPQRVLTQPYTVEPTQEGERSVMLRRVGTSRGSWRSITFPPPCTPIWRLLK